tara:strand:+ start:11191 stop:11418 length:228 start_codon:yes stop_codon:yes gene_type:complete
MEIKMKKGIILNKNKKQLEDDYGQPIKIILTTNGKLVLKHQSLDYTRISRNQLVLDSDVVELLKERLNNKELDNE